MFTNTDTMVNTCNATYKGMYKECEGVQRWFLDYNNFPGRTEDFISPDTEVAGIITRNKCLSGCAFHTLNTGTSAKDVTV